MAHANSQSEQKLLPSSSKKHVIMIYLGNA